MGVNADFSGYATKAGLKCSDGRTITPEAFKHMDGQKVPLVWQHGHSDSKNVLGHAVLEVRGDGVYAYGYFNDTDSGINAKKLVQHEDVKALSIYANQLVEKSKSVLHGMIREVSLVLSGANPGAFIDNVTIAHSDGDTTELEDEAIISAGEPLEHEDRTDAVEHADDDATVQDVYDTMDDDQKGVLHYMVAEALKAAKVEHSDDGDSDSTASTADNTNEGDLNHQEGSETMTNVFEQGADGATGVTTDRKTLTHSQIATLVADAQEMGSLKASVLAHADEYGITNIEMLFPDAQAIDNKPEWITRRMEWVEKVLNGTRKLPFSKIKSLSADLTHEEARAKGYIKASMKKTQFFEVAKRETGPKTIYKKQKLDRDDIVDMTEFDIVAWLWVEMRFMLREEIARAVLIGDGREVDDEDKIDENKIRPIAMDDEFYTDVVHVPTSADGHSLIEAVLRARKNYKGSGNPSAFMTEDVLTDLLLLKDKMNRRLYNTTADLAAALRVSDITPVPVLEDAKRGDDDILMVLVNLADYSVGSTRGGEVSTFEQFDIDFNQHKYLIEGRMSGALTKHKTAQVILREGGGTEVLPVSPTFVPATGVVTVADTTGVEYRNGDTDEVLVAGAQPALAPGDSLEVEAYAETGYYFPHNTDNDWTFTRPQA